MIILWKSRTSIDKLINYENKKITKDVSSTGFTDYRTNMNECGNKHTTEIGNRMTKIRQNAPVSIIHRGIVFARVVFLNVCFEYDESDERE